MNYLSQPLAIASSMKLLGESISDWPMSESQSGESAILEPHEIMAKKAAELFSCFAAINIEAQRQQLGQGRQDEAVIQAGLAAFRWAITHSKGLPASISKRSLGAEPSESQKKIDKIHGAMRAKICQMIDYDFGLEERLSRDLFNAMVREAIDGSIAVRSESLKPERGEHGGVEARLAILAPLMRELGWMSRWNDESSPSTAAFNIAQEIEAQKKMAHGDAAAFRTAGVDGSQRAASAKSLQAIVAQMPRLHPYSQRQSPQAQRSERAFNDATIKAVSQSYVRMLIAGEGQDDDLFAQCRELLKAKAIGLSRETVSDLARQMAAFGMVVDPLKTITMLADLGGSDPICQAAMQFSSFGFRGAQGSPELACMFFAMQAASPAPEAIPEIVQGHLSGKAATAAAAQHAEAIKHSELAALHGGASRGEIASMLADDGALAKKDSEECRKCLADMATACARAPALLDAIAEGRPLMSLCSNALAGVLLNWAAAEASLEAETLVAATRAPAAEPARNRRRL